MISLIVSVAYTILISYLISLLLLIIFPFPFQPLAMYLHWINFPFGVNWQKGGERFGFRAGSVRPFFITTKDGIRLGAWHISPRSSHLLEETDNEEMNELCKADIVYLYFHGNAGNRATYHRTSFYKLLTGIQSKKSHVITIDYRGFGNSTNLIPTEDTLRIDARSAFDWIIENGVDLEKVVIVGHSLGSGIAADLAYRLCVEHQQNGRPLFKGLILLSGYSSIADAALGYPNVPFLRPFNGNSWTENIVKFLIRDKLITHHKLRSIKSPILFLHGSCDTDICCWQAKANFLEAVGGRTGKKLVDSNGFWELRNVSSVKPLDIKDLPEVGHNTLPGDEGELWFSNTSSHIWLVLVTWASHNDLSNHQIVQDSIESWLRK